MIKFRFQEEKMNVVNLQNLDRTKFSKFRKIALTRARLLDTTDFLGREGKIVTKEGTVTFKAGDYLAVGVQGEEWPITAETMKETKHQISAVDADGWADYATTITVEAIQMPESFSVILANGDEILGKAGDYLIDNGKSQWVVDQAIFAKTYARV